MFQSDWVNSHTGEVWKVRKLVRLDAIPTVTSSGNRTTASVAIEAIEGGEIWRKRTGAWDEMTPAEFAHWRGGAQDKHSAKALLIKEYNPQNGVSIIRQEITGDGDKVPDSRYNEGESGINITAEWKGDTLSIRWSGTGTKPQTELVTVPFSGRFRQDPTGESAAPSDGEKPAN